LCTSRIARDGEEVHIYITYLTLFAYWQSATRVFRENINLLQHGETINHKRDAQLEAQRNGLTKHVVMDVYILLRDLGDCMHPHMYLSNIVIITHKSYTCRLLCSIFIIFIENAKTPSFQLSRRQSLWRGAGGIRGQSLMAGMLDGGYVV
jgi:hypothetical protein